MIQDFADLEPLDEEALRHATLDDSTLRRLVQGILAAAGWECATRFHPSRDPHKRGNWGCYLQRDRYWVGLDLDAWEPVTLRRHPPLFLAILGPVPQALQHVPQTPWAEWTYFSLDVPVNAAPAAIVAAGAALIALLPAA